MSQWARIEAAADAPEDQPQPTSARASPAPPVRRLRVKREERLVLGSIDAGAHVFQRHTREAVLGSAVFLVPAILVNLVLSTVLFNRFDSFSDSVVSIPELVGGVDAATGADTVLAYVGIITTSMAAALSGGYLAALCTDYSFANPVSIRRSLGATVRRLPALLGGWVVGHVWFVLGMIGVVRADDAGLTAWLLLGGPVGLLLVALIVLVSPVIVVERRGVIGGLRRAVRLARSRFGACLGFVTASAVVGLALRFGITFLPRLAESTGLVTFGSYGWLVEGIAAQLAQLLTIPVVALATAAFYIQLRVHAEGMDLVLAADRAFGPSS